MLFAHLCSETFLGSSLPFAVPRAPTQVTHSLEWEVAL